MVEHHVVLLEKYDVSMVLLNGTIIAATTYIDKGSPLVSLEECANRLALELGVGVERVEVPFQVCAWPIHLLAEWWARRNT